MPKPISIAMACSVAIHLALFVFVDRLLSLAVSPSVISTPLLVSVRQPQPAGDLANDHRASPADEGATDALASRMQPARALDNASGVAEAVDMSLLDPEPAPELTASEDLAADDRQLSAVEASGAGLQEVDEVAPSGVVTTARSAEPVIVAAASTPERPRAKQAEIPSKQKKMLNAKVRKWTENLHKMPDVASGSTWKYKGQEYRASFTQLPAADDMGIQRVIVEISTEEDGKRLTSRVHMKRLAFSNFAQFVNRWDPNVEIHNDELVGRFHSNTEITLNYDRKVQPLFHGKVTTASRRINVTNSRGMTRRDLIFLGGLQTGVKSIRLPKHYLPLPDEAEIDDHQVRRFGEDTRITFRGDGSYAWQAINSESGQQMADLSEDTTYLVADSKVDLHVKGTVNGKVLVYSPERIVIEDDLVYEQHPEDVPDADDYLGLVSDRYVDIAPADVTGPGDLLINAAIYAKRRFAVRGFRARQSALLYLYGSLSVGSLSATEPRYYTRIQFDRRLEDLRPPGFPVTDRYEVESWDTTWTVEPIE